jgi:hypothetical protein
MNLRKEINNIAKYFAISGMAMISIALLVAFLGLLQHAYRVDMRFSSNAPMVRVDFIVSQSASHLTFRRFVTYIESFFITPASGQVCEATPHHKTNSVG